MTTMTPNRATDRQIVRARSLAHVAIVAESVCPSVHASAHAPVDPSTTVATPTANTMNLWLGAVQSKGFCSKYATKRILPGRLAGMT